MTRVDNFISNLLRISDPLEARVAAFTQIRNIRYCLVSGESTAELMLERGAGDCRAKTELLMRTFKVLGYPARSIRIKYQLLNYPEEVRFIPGQVDYHHTCQIYLNDSWLIVDPTYDPELSKGNFIVNIWDGLTATSSAVSIISEEYNDPETFELEFKQFLRILEEAVKKYPEELKSYTKKFNEMLLKVREGDSDTLYQVISSRS